MNDRPERRASPAVIEHQLREAEEEIRRLVEALTYASNGIYMAYEAVSAGCYDEALLHLGHHEAAAHRLLSQIEAK